jgi:hypothetical protein
VQRGNLTAERQQAQARATFKRSPLVAGQAVLAQVMPAFRAERARVGDGFPIGLNKRERFLRCPRPVRGREASALFARAVGCWCVAFQDVSDGVGGEVDAVLGEVSGEVLASVVVFFGGVAARACLSGSVVLGWCLGGFGQVVQSVFAVLFRV